MKSENVSPTRVWSPQQQNIFKWFKEGSGNLIVRARAGTGKTTTIVEALRHAPERRVLVAAFNKRIADDMERRIADSGRFNVEVKTLHALGLTFIKRHYAIKEIDQKGKRARSLVTTAAAKTGLTAAHDRTTRDAIELCGRILTKVREVDPLCDTPLGVHNVMVNFDLIPDFWLVVNGWDADTVANIVRDSLQLALAPTNVIDFADMVFLPLRSKWVAGLFDMVVVDEAQDMNIGQLLLAVRACRPDGRVVLVGDDRQAIYGFRGAVSDGLDKFKEELNAAERSLTVSYRCPTVVAEYAQTLVPDFEAASGAPAAVISRISANTLAEHAQIGDFVLSRYNAPLTAACLLLLGANIPARIVGRDIGKDLTAFIKKLDPLSLKHLDTLMTEWEKEELKRINKTNADVDVKSQRIQMVYDRVATVRTLAGGASKLSELYGRIVELFDDSDDDKLSDKCVVLSSIHRAKGLEAECVFVLEDTLRVGHNREEDNIAYVAVTRAKYNLVWVHGFNLRRRNVDFEDSEDNT